MISEYEHFGVESSEPASGTPEHVQAPPAPPILQCVQCRSWKKLSGNFRWHWTMRTDGKLICPDCAAEMGS